MKIKLSHRTYKYNTHTLVECMSISMKYGKY